MAIIIFPTMKEDGYGDISFMVQVANTLSEEKNTEEPIVIVSEHKDLIQKNYTLRDNITLLNIEEFEELSKEKHQIVPSLIIEGPTYFFGRGITTHPSVPILYLREYSSNESITLTDPATLLNLAKKRGFHAVNLNSGFRKPRSRIIKKQEHENEYGIFVLRELTALVDEMQIDEQKKDGCWLSVSANIKQIITTEPYSDFASRHKLYFQYSHHEQSIDKFIKLIGAIESPTLEKDCVFLSIGKTERNDTLKSCINDLRKVGYTKITLLNETGKELILFEDKEKQGPTFKLIHLKQLKHDDFINLMALSERIVGATGDQSFSEVLSLGKIPVYECRKHKEAFYKGLLELCNLNQWMELADYLKMAVTYTDDLDTPENQKTITNIPLNFETVCTQFMLLRAYIIDNYDYLEKIKSVVNELLNSEPRQSAAKTLLLKRIDSRIEELAPNVKSGNNAFNELEVLCNFRRLMFSGLSISQSLETIHNDFFTGTPESFFKKTITIPKFVTEYLEKENEELSQISVRATQKGVNLLNFQLR